MERSPRSAPASPAMPSLRLAFGDFLLDEADARLSRGGRPIALPPKAFAVLCVLVRHAGRLVGKDALLDAVWGHRHISESVLKSTVSQVRAALGDTAREPRYIETASRHGYRFIAAVAPSSPEPAVPEAPVGRAVVLRRLDALWADATSGRRRLVWLAGEAGIGKTTVLDAWIARAGESRVARGQCLDAFGAGEPYLPFLAAVSDLCRSEPALVDTVRRFAPTWLLQLPALLQPGEGAALHAVLAGAGPERMLREGCELLEALGRDGPLIVAIEDLHLGDGASVRLLDAFARRSSPARVLILGSFRPIELVATEHPLNRSRHALRAHGLCEEISLEPLTTRDVGDLARRYLPGVDDAAVAQAVHARTEGLPLFLVNVLDDLARRRRDGSFEGEELLRRIESGLPDSLGGLLAGQLAALAADDRALLGAASLRGQFFDARDAAAVTGRDVASVTASLLAQTRGGMWIEDAGIEIGDDGGLRARFRFRHALYVQALSAGLAALERAEGHRRLALDLAARRGAGETVAAAEIAVHLERGRAPDEARRWYSEAAAHALARFAPDEAMAHAERGLSLPAVRADESSTRSLEMALRVTRGVAAAQRRGVGSEDALMELERARVLSESVPHGPQHVWLLNGLGWLHFSRGELGLAAADGRAMARRAERESDPVLALCAANLMGATRLHEGELTEAEDWLDRALAALPICGERSATVRSIVDLETSVRVYRAKVSSYRARTLRAAQEAGRALARARSLGQPMSLCLALRAICLAALRADDVPALTAASIELHETAARHGAAQSLGPARWYRGWAMARSGELAAGLASIQEGIAGHRALGMATGRPLAEGLAATIELELGRLSHARESVRRALDDALARGERLDTVRLLRVRARVARAEGDAEVARRADAEAVSLAEATGVVEGA